MEWSTIVALVGFSYGTVGLIMWVITQVRLTRVERRVTKKIDDGAVAIEGRMNKAMDRLDAKVEEIKTELPEIELPELTMEPEQIDMIASKMYAMFQGERGNAMRDMQKELAKFGNPLEELAEGIMDNARMAQGPTDVAIMRMLNVELNPAFKKKNPHLAFLIESGKVTIAQLAELAKQTGLLNTREAGAGELSPTRGTIGVR